MSREDAEKSDASPSPSPLVERTGSVSTASLGVASGKAATESSAFQSSPLPPLLRNSGPAPVRRHSSANPPGLDDDLSDLMMHRGSTEFSPEQAIDSQVVELEAWALTNVRAERMDSLRFWGMRVLAFLGAAAGAAAAALQQTELAVGAGVLAASAIVVDAAWPSVGDRIARRRAIHDLRELQHSLRIKWDKVRLCHPNANAPKRIAHALVLLDQIQAKREEIGRYLGDASPGVRGSR